jgi:hypothetical protein
VKLTDDCVFPERKGYASGHACAHRSSTVSEGFVSVHYMCECVCCYYFANPSTVSVCLTVHVRACVCPPYNRTPTHSHTSWYSRHLCHILESVGRHRRDTHKRKTQCTTFRGAGACAHERRAGVVAAEGAAAKGHCPRYGRASDRAFVIHQWTLLGTDRRAEQLVLGQIKFPAQMRYRGLDRQLSCILRKANKTICIHTHTHTHTHTQFT